MANTISIQIIVSLLILMPLEGFAQVQTYRLEPRTKKSVSVMSLYSPEQVALLEKLNRADALHLDRLSVLVIPSRWDPDELTYSPLPEMYACCSDDEQFIVIHLPGQVFGAYEQGRLVRWGPVSSGDAHQPTPEGLYHLNWRTRGRTSTVDPDWYMEWYFNFENHLGIALHVYAMPGRPASHGCIRLLERDAIWMYGWADEWQLAPNGVRVLQPGTPLLITGNYDFDQPPPWRSLDWLGRRIELPPALPAAVSFRASPFSDMPSARTLWRP